MAAPLEGLVFNILCGNTDDHARNHAAFWDGKALTMTPAYDICPQGRTGNMASQAMLISGNNNITGVTLSWVHAKCKLMIRIKNSALAPRCEQTKDCHSVEYAIFSLTVFNGPRWCLAMVYRRTSFAIHRKEKIACWLQHPETNAGTGPNEPGHQRQQRTYC